jgi:predicted Zn-ribbon and HTH transcriptional regulator
MFRVRCKACQHLFSIPDEKVGEPIRCPYCQNDIVIRPNGATKVSGVSSAASVGSRAMSPPRTAVLPQDDEDEAIVLGEKDSPPLASVSLPHRARAVEAVFVNCRSCGLRMQISSRDLGKAVQCASCKAVMKVELPTVEASLGMAVAVDEDDPLETPLLAQPALEDIRVTGSFARRRAHTHSGAGERIVVGIFAVLLLGGFAWMGHYFMKQNSNPLRPKPAETRPSSTAGPIANPAPPQTVVDTYSWVDAQNPIVWDKFIDATWGESPSDLPGLTPTEPPTMLFDAGNLKWFKPAEAPKPIGQANVRSILYAFLPEGGALRLCEIQVQCQSTYDSEQLQTWLTRQYGNGTTGQSTVAEIEWQGRTSAGRDVLIEIGGKTPSFNGSQVRASIQGVR